MTISIELQQILASNADWIAPLSDIGTLVATVATILAVLYTARQVSHGVRVSGSNFVLELERMFIKHNPIHMKLRPGGVWSTGGKGPTTPDDWVLVEDYMGLFEHCELMMQRKLISRTTFKRMFAYRIPHIIKNEKIKKEKLVNKYDDWVIFHQLLRRLGTPVSRPEAPAVDNSQRSQEAAA